MIERYFERVAGCRTLNQVNAVHIAMTNLMTPMEALAVRDRLAGGGWAFPSNSVGAEGSAKLTAMLATHMDKIVGDFVEARKERAEVFLRIPVARDVWLFSRGGDRTSKTLVIAFTGNADRLMMPTPTFMQHLDADTVDVLLLVDRTKQGYRGGLVDTAASIADLILALPKLGQTQHYRRIVTAGTSGGGLPSVLAGLKLGADAVMAVGCRTPHAGRWQDLPGVGLGGAELLAEWQSGTTARNVSVIHGAQYAQDAAAAAEIAGLITARVVPVSVEGIEVQHNALYPLVRAGRFSAFLYEHLGL
jgi:hypothetical protein